MGYLWRLPQVISISEPQAIAAALRVASHKPMLTDYHVGFPIIPLPYGALEYWVPGVTARLLHDVTALSVLRVGRCFSLLSFGCIILILLKLSRQDGLSWKTTLLAPLPLFWFAYPLRWAIQFAPDFPAVGFSLAGWCVCRAAARVNSQGERRIRMVVQAILWTIAFHIKPTMIPGLIGFLCEVLALTGTKKDPGIRTIIRRCAYSGALLIVLVVSSSVTLNYLTDGGWYLNAIKSSVIFDYSERHLLASLSFRPALVPLLLVFLLINVLLASRLWISRAVLFTAAVECAFMTKQGSNLDYLLGSISLFGLSLPYALLLLKQQYSGANHQSWLRVRSHMAPIVTVVMSLLLAGALAAGARSATFARNEFPVPSPAEIATLREKVQMHSRESVLCLDPFAAQSCGAFYPYAEPLHIARLLQLHSISLDTIVDRINKREFDTIVVNPYYFKPPEYHDLLLFPQVLQQSIKSGYEVETCGRWLCFLRPVAKH